MHFFASSSSSSSSLFWVVSFFYSFLLRACRRDKEGSSVGGAVQFTCPVLPAGRSYPWNRRGICCCWSRWSSRSTTTTFQRTSDNRGADDDDDQAAFSPWRDGTLRRRRWWRFGRSVRTIFEDPLSSGSTDYDPIRQPFGGMSSTVVATSLPSAWWRWQYLQQRVFSNGFITVWDQSQGESSSHTVVVVAVVRAKRERQRERREKMKTYENNDIVRMTRRSATTLESRSQSVFEHVRARNCGNGKKVEWERRARMCFDEGVSKVRVRLFIARTLN